MEKKMTTEEFNTKYKNYLEEGHYGLGLENPQAIKYLDKEFKELIKIEGFKYYQIKQKFSWFCFYCSPVVPYTKVVEIGKKLKEIYNG